MANYSVHVSTVKRSSGQNAIASAAYNSRSNLTLNVTDKVTNITVQFAWDYSNPEDSVGWRFSYHVPAYYKSQGYKYLYLGDHHDYKSRIQGYEILGSCKK